MVNTGVNFYKYIFSKKKTKKKIQKSQRKRNPKMKYEDFVRRQKTSAYAFDEDLMKANGECSLLSKKSILKTLF